MVGMELINLDDSVDKVNTTVSSAPTTPLTSASQNHNKKIKKRNRNFSRKMKKLNKLNELLNGKTNNFDTNNLDSSLILEDNRPSFINSSTSSETDSPKLKSRRVIGKRLSAVQKKKRRKKSSIVIIDSDDDCVVINNKPYKNNNNVVTDILSLSDNSVIELSDTEDTGVVTGMVETTKNGEWRNIREAYDNANQSAFNNRSEEGTTLVDQLYNDSQSIFQLRERLQKVFGRKPKENKNDKKFGSSSARITKLTEIPSATKKAVPRNSISYLPVESTSLVREGPRPIIIDGCNVAFGHGKERFSARGIEICIDYFIRRKHTEVRAFVPQFRRRHPATIGIHIMEKLEKDGYLVYTPSRQVDGKRITSYDDRFIVEYAAKMGGIIVTRDNYQDLLAENQDWRDTINFRLLQYTFVGDMIMFPQDPLGRGGPTLDRFLMF